jgi:hypothetical protein
VLPVLLSTQFQLVFNQVEIGPFLFNQALMVALLYNAPFFDDDDLICIAYCAKAVSNNDCCTTLKKIDPAAL